MTIWKKANADPSQADDAVGGDADVYEVTLASGTASLTFDEPFDQPPTIIATSASGDAGYSNLTASGVDLSGTGSDVVAVLAIGPRGTQ